MKKSTLHIISIFFISLLLFKGIGSAFPLIFSSFENASQIELLTENDAEEQKNNAPKSAESNPMEELFDHQLSTSYFSYINIPGSLSSVIAEAYLPHVCLDIPTPPPNPASVS